MICYKDKIFPEYFIDPVTAIITNSKGEVQETKINECGRQCFHCMEIHKIQIHTHLVYKKGFDIHHIDKNKLNNALSNLVYLTKQKMSEAAKGRIFSEETKRKLSESHKGKTSNVKDRTWVNNGVIAKMVKCDDIPSGFKRGMLRK